MKEIVDYIDSGRPHRRHCARRLMRSTIRSTRTVPYASYSYNNKESAGGFGRQVLGETWVNHYGTHQKQSTRGVIVAGHGAAPDSARRARSVGRVRRLRDLDSLTGDSQPLVMGQVLESMDPTAPPDPAKKLMPVAWTKTYTGESGKPARIFTTTMGHVMDFRNRGLPAHAGQRLLLGRSGSRRRSRRRRSVEFAGPFEPHPIGVRRVTP